MKNILTQEEVNHIEELCEMYNIENYTINSDGSIDVDGSVDLSDRDLNKLPLQFGKVSGNFFCGYNNLTSLEGCPTSLGCNFNCIKNNLILLEFSPTSVGRNFYCGGNLLTSLEGCPISVGGGFYCNDNNLTSLKEITSSVGGSFICYGNNLPNHFTNLYNELSPGEFKIFFKYQHDLRIWEGEYKEEAAQDLFDEIKDGML